MSKHNDSDDLVIVDEKPGDIVLVDAVDWNETQSGSKKRIHSPEVDRMNTLDDILIQEIQEVEIQQDADYYLALKFQQEEQRLAERENEKRIKLKDGLGSQASGGAVHLVPPSLGQSQSSWSSSALSTTSDVIDLSEESKPYSIDLDLAEALQIQELINAEGNLEDAPSNGQRQTPLELQPRTNRSVNTSDPMVFDLESRYREYDQRFFNRVLQAFKVTVQWSKQMTLCAGICYFKPQKDSCIVRLSEPLLKLRPIEDSVDTLLHEMIHAYCFVTGSSQGRDGHGADFQKHMHRINAEAATTITVFHSFHDEVRHYKKHAWRCNGPCRNRHPYYGWVRRSRNRKPQKADSWWEQHQRTCGGEFVKVAGPEMESKNGKITNHFRKVGDTAKGRLENGASSSGISSSSNSSKKAGPPSCRDEKQHPAKRQTSSDRNKAKKGKTVIGNSRVRAHEEGSFKGSIEKDLPTGIKAPAKIKGSSDLASLVEASSDSTHASPKPAEAPTKNSAHPGVLGNPSTKHSAGRSLSGSSPIKGSALPVSAKAAVTNYWRNRTAK